MKYWAFLSYSHTDKKWGDWLHKALETYRVPRRLVGRESRDGRVPARLFPIFRDREELPVSADLSSNINEALQESRYLIVICSPRSAQSRWVGEEIKTFKQLGREDRILALIIDGEPNAADGKPGFVADDECFPEPVRYRWGGDGQLSSERTEPIAADAREGKGGKNNAKLKLLAGLLGVNYDDLKQREQERRIRRARAVGLSALILLGIFAALAIALFFKERDARAQKTEAERAREDAHAQQVLAEHSRDAATRSRDEARATLSRSDLAQGLRLIDQGKDYDALAQLSRSLRFDSHNQAAVCRLVTLLTYRNYPLPLWRSKTDCAADLCQSAEKIVAHDARTMPDITGVAKFSPDGTQVVTAFGRVARLCDSQTGKPIGDPMEHSSYVRGPQFSPDGRWIMTISEKTVHIWDAKTQKRVIPSISADDLVRLVHFSPDSARLAVVSGSKAGVWEVETRRFVSECKHDDGIISVQFSPDGTQILTSSRDNSARVWDVRTANPVIHPIKPGGFVTGAAFNPDGKRVMTVSIPQGVQIWDAKSGALVSQPIKHQSAASPQFSPDGKRVITADGRVVCVWSVDSGALLIPPMTHDANVRSMHFNANGKRIVTSSGNTEGGSARTWDALTGAPVSEPMTYGANLALAEFSSDGKLILTTSWDSFRSEDKGMFTASWDRAARVWSTAEGRPLSEPLKHPEFVLPAGMPPTGVTLAQFDPSGDRVITASNDTVRIWSASEAKQLVEPIKHASFVTSARFSPDGTRIVTVSGRSARIWSAESGKPLSPLMEHQAPISSAQFSPDGTRIATAAEDNTACIWNADLGKRLFSLNHSSPPVAVEFSGDSQRIVTASAREVRVWDAATGRSLAEPIRHEWNVRSAKFSPSGEMIVTAGGIGLRAGIAQVWDALTGKPLGKPMKHDDLVQSAQFSADGKRVLTASYIDGSARIWSAETGELEMEPMKHDALITCAQFSKDAQQVVTASFDNTARVWDALSGKPVTDSFRHRPRYFVNWAQFAPDGKRLVTASVDNTARLWDIWPNENPWPEWLRRLSETVAGQHLDDQGVFKPRAEDVETSLNEIKDQLSRESADSGWTVWGRWFLADRSARTISPFSKVTVPEYIENRIKENTAQSLEEAEGLAVGNAKLLTRIATLRAALPQ